MYTKSSCHPNIRRPLASLLSVDATLHANFVPSLSQLDRRKNYSAGPVVLCVKTLGIIASPSFFLSFYPTLIPKAAHVLFQLI